MLEQRKCTASLQFIYKHVYKTFSMFERFTWPISKKKIKYFKLHNCKLTFNTNLSFCVLERVLRKFDRQFNIGFGNMQNKILFDI